MGIVGRWRHFSAAAAPPCTDGDGDGDGGGDGDGDGDGHGPAVMAS